MDFGENDMSCRFISHPKCTTVVWDVGSGEDSFFLESRLYGKISVPLFQFSCERITA
jgi:hypothetical protein